jgi:hypothetical protein
MGVMQNLERGIGAIRGEVPPEEVNTAPKTMAYGDAILDAVPFTDVSVPVDDLRAGEGWTPERLDYMQIGSHVVHGNPDQGMLMFSKSSPGPLSKHSMLSTERVSPQDTWMEAISTGQPMSMKLSKGSPLRKPPSPAKRVIDKGAPLDAATLGPSKLGITVAKVGPIEVTPADVRHTFHDKATRQAAENYGRVSHDQFGEDISIPSLAMQETTWNEARAVAAGGSNYNQEAKADKPPTKKALQEEARTNPRLFSVDKPTGPKGEPPFLTPKRVEQGPPWPTAMTAGENTRAVQERRRKDEATDD